MKNLLLVLICIFGGGANAAVTLKVEAEKSVLPAGSMQEAMVRIAVSAAPVEKTSNTPKVNLSIAFDNSGSMHGQNKIQNARLAARNAVDLLADGDLFSLVLYNSSAKVLIPATSINASSRAEIKRTIDQIATMGNTALFAGVSLSADELRRNIDKPGWVNRLILLSDGQANVGPSSASELGRLGAALVKEGISVSTVGVGTDYNEDLMTSLAQNSDGNFYFVENSSQLSLILEKELGSALSVAAQGIKIKITCPPGIKPRGIVGHQCKIENQTIEMKFNQLYSGHDKVLILQLEVPAQPAGNSTPLANVKLEYELTDSQKITAVDRSVTVAFTTDQAVAAASLNKAVSADVAIQQSNVLREEAIKEADAGNYKGGVQKLERAQSILASNAEITDSPAVRQNADDMLQEQQKLEKAEEKPSLYNAARKVIMGRSYQSKNSQNYRQ